MPPALSPALRTILAALRAARPDPVPIPTLALLLLWPDAPARRTRIRVQMQVYRLRVAIRQGHAAEEVVTVTREDGSTAYGLAPADPSGEHP